MWSKKHKKCFKCGTTSNPHSGYGFCNTCYKRWYAIEHAEELRDNKRRYKQRKKILKSTDQILKTNLRETSYFRGKQAEKLALTLLPGSIQEIDAHAPFDLIWNGKKINVKSANLANYKYSFTLYGSQSKCEYLFCIGLKDKKIDKCWMIPTNIIPKTKNSIAFGAKSSSYDKYLF